MERKELENRRTEELKWNERREKRELDGLCVCRGSLRFRHISLERKVAREKKFRKPGKQATHNPFRTSRRKRHEQIKQTARNTHSPSTQFNGTKSFYCVHPGVCSFFSLFFYFFNMLNNKPLNYIKCSCSHFVGPTYILVASKRVAQCRQNIYH